MLIPIVVVAAVMLLLYPQNCIESARDGLNLWLLTVLPALLPFMTASFVLMETGVVRFISSILMPMTRVIFRAPGESAFVFIASAMSGYPAGARLTGELYKKGRISEAQAQHIMRFTSVSGPVFLSGAVGTGMLFAPYASAYLLAAHYASALIVGIILGLFEKRQTLAKVRWRDVVAQLKKDVCACPSTGHILSSSVEKSLRTLLQIGGFIMLFSVILKMLEVTGTMDALVWLYTPAARLAGLDAAASEALLAGGIEMTNGCARVAALNVSIHIKLMLVSGIVAFGGLCIHMQTKSVLAPCDLVPKRFVLVKSLQAALCCTLTSLLLAVFPPAIETAAVEPTQIKTAAYGGIIYAAGALALLLLIKLWQRRHYSLRPPESSMRFFRSSFK